MVLGSVFTKSFQSGNKVAITWIVEIYKLPLAIAHLQFSSYDDLALVRIFHRSVQVRKTVRLAYQRINDNPSAIIILSIQHWIKIQPHKFAGLSLRCPIFLELLKLK